VTSSYLRRLESIGVEETDLYTDTFEPVGCDSCENTGYKGRVGIYEMLLVEGPVRDAIHSSTRSEEISEFARSVGFRTMQEDALDKVKDATTTLEEVQRVVPFDPIRSEQCQSCSRDMMPGFSYCPFCGASRRKVERLQFSGACQVS
jgi:hypothetical protein